MNRALLVGINAYPSPNQLHGCINDVNDMAGFLVAKCGFGHDDVRLVTDARATANAIRDRLGWLLNGVKKGDRVLFHYSGHGAQVTMRNPQGQTDRIHEVICPVDFDFDEPSSMICDTDFKRLFSAVPSGVEFVWVSDSCFSGGLTRALMPLPANVTAMKPKTYIMPADIEWRNRSAAAKNLKPLGVAAAAHQINAALISGCTATQTSADAEISGRFNGALTYFLLHELKAANGLKAPLTQVVKTVVHDLTAQRYEQHPELLGSMAIRRRAFLSA